MRRLRVKIKFRANWCREWGTEGKKGIIPFLPFGVYQKQIDQFLVKLEKYQADHGELRELDITVEYHYKKRTLSMNNLMWELYAIEANEQNQRKN